MTVTEKLDKILEEVSGLKPLVNDHHKTLYGNGQTGLKDRMVVVETDQKALSGLPAKVSAIETKQNNRSAVQAYTKNNVVFAIALIGCVLGIMTFIGRLCELF